MTDQQLVNLPGTVPVRSVENLSPLQFWLHCRFGDQPLHIRGGVKGWRAFQTWNLDHLSRTLAATPVVLATTRQGIFDYNANATTAPVTERESVPFAQAVELIRQSSDSGTDFAYIQQHSIAEKFPELLDDLARPQWLDFSKFVYEANLWVGSAGCFSPLHYDLADNFLVQIAGRKHLTLFDKRDAAHLYPNVGQELDHCSRINLRQPDYASYPLLERAKPYSALLEPGDLIYIPRRWWHAVQSLDSSISINYWWGGPLDGLRNAAQMVWSREGREEIVGFLRGLRASGAGK